MNAVSIKPLTRGYLVTGYGPDGIDEAYAEDSVLSAFHCAARLLGVEPALLHVPAPELRPEMAALQERQEADDPQVGDLKAGEAFAPRESGC